MNKRKCPVTDNFCTYYLYQLDRNNQVDIEYCNHPKNLDDHEGNCTKKLCPRKDFKFCTKCEGSGQIYSGHFSHPETNSSGKRQSIMYHCIKCDGTGVM